MEQHFSYRKEGNDYVFYRDEELIHLCDNTIISTANELLAADLLIALQKKEHPGDPTSLLHYHFATLLEKVDDKINTDEISNLCYDDFLNDNYLMFHQVAPMRQIIAQHFADNLPAFLESLPVYKRMATVLFAQTCHSYMLAYYLIIDVIEQENVEESKEAFLDDLLEFYGDFFDTEDEAASFLKDITPVINTYVRYMSYDSV